MVGIYKITSPRNKIYIGQSLDLVRREKEYKRLHCKGQPKLYYSLKKYGIENHIFEVIEFCSIIDLNDKERYYQDLFNSVGDFGLNLKLTSDNCRSGKLSDETKKKISKSNTGRIVSKESRLKMSIAKKGVPRTKGLIRSESHCRKISESKMGCKTWNKNIPRTAAEKANMSKNRIGKMMGANNHGSVLILNLFTGTFYFGIREASESFDGNYYSMRDRLNGKTKNKTPYRKV